MNPLMNKILFVDEDKITREMVGNILETNGYQVLCFPSFQRVMTGATKFKPDLIVLMLRNYRAWERTDFLKTYPDTKDIPLIVYPIDTDNKENWNHKPDSTLKPPIESSVLLETIATLLES